MLPQQGPVHLFLQGLKSCGRPLETFCVPCIICGQGSELNFLLPLLYYDSPRHFHFGEKILD